VLCQRVRPGVAVEDAYYARSLRLRDERARVVLGLSSMNHDWPPHLRGEGDLSRKRGALSLTRRVVVVIVEAAFADGNGGSQQLAQPRNIAPFVEGGSIVRMDSRSREDKAGVLGRVRGRERRRLQRLSDADDGRRARVAGARDYRVAVAGERRVGEVGMAVDEDGRTPPVLRGHLRSIQRSTGAAM
jgi:hypothetical protein